MKGNGTYSPKGTNVISLETLCCNLNLWFLFYFITVVFKVIQFFKRLISKLFSKKIHCDFKYLLVQELRDPKDRVGKRVTFSNLVLAVYLTSHLQMIAYTFSFSKIYFPAHRWRAILLLSVVRPSDPAAVFLQCDHVDDFRKFFFTWASKWKEIFESAVLN